MQAVERFAGAMLGLAAGDALGTTVEFCAPGSFEPLIDIVGGGPFGLQPGQWTDDTAMALCIAESLVECGTFDARDQMTRYVRWFREGHLSSNGTCFDIGNATRAALLRYEQTGEPLAGSTDPHTAGNGSLMRLAPVVLAFAGDRQRAVAYAGESSRTTHGAREAVDACRYFATLLVSAIEGATKDAVLGGFEATAPEWADTPLAPAIEEIAAGSFRGREPPTVVGSGYVVRSLEAALWAFDRTDSFREGALAAVNLGDDADTTGAIYGQIAGAYYGARGIPEAWREKLALRSTIERLADGLFLMSGR